MKEYFVAASLSLALLICLIVPRADAQGCTFEGKGYFNGQVACQDGSKMKCKGGSWVQTGGECVDRDSDEDAQQPEAKGPGKVKMPADPVVPDAEE